MMTLSPTTPFLAVGPFRHISPEFFLPGYDIGLEPLSVIYVADHHLLIGKHAGFF